MSAYIQNNPRKTLLFVLYILAALASVFIFHWTFWQFLLAILAVTVLFILVFFTTFAAIMGNLLYIGTERPNALMRFAVAHNTPSPAAYMYYANIRMREGDCAEALALLDKAWEKNPNVLHMKNIQLARASCHWVMGDLQKAKELLEDMRRKYEYVNEHVLTTLGYVYLCLGDFENACEVTMKAIENAPAFGSAWDNLGQIRLKQGELGEAKEAFLKAVELRADLPDSLYYLGKIAKAEGNPDEAREYLERALKCKINALNTVTREQIEEELE